MTNDKTGEITIKLTEKNGQFLYILAFPSAGLVPSKTPFEEQSKNPPPGLGAYAFEEGSVEPNRGWVMVKNKNFALGESPRATWTRSRSC